MVTGTLFLDIVFFQIFIDRIFSLEIVTYRILIQSFLVFLFQWDYYFARGSGGEVLWWARTCVSVCLSVSVSVCPRAYLWSHRRYLYQFFVHVAYGPGSFFFRQVDKISTRMGNFGVFLPIDNAFNSRAFGTHAKTAEPINMPFGVMTQIGHGYHVLDGGPDPQRGMCNFGGKCSCLL